MAKFLTGNALNAELENIFENADVQLILISPYIKLHDRYLSALKAKMDDPNLELVVVFGKNEDDPSRSMRQEDLKFFIQFPNVEIRYEKRLHAKYYANESAAIMTSMNLYSYSQDNNIEAGVLTKNSTLGKLMNNVTREDNFDTQAWAYFDRVREQADLLFQKTPDFENGFMGLSSKYKGSTVKADNLSSFFSGAFQCISKPKKEFKASEKTSLVGYCIRTGIEIPYDITRPLAYSSYKIWVKMGENPNYPEKYCHKTGKPSNGKTSMKNPIL